MIYAILGLMLLAWGFFSIKKTNDIYDRFDKMQSEIDELKKDK